MAIAKRAAPHLHPLSEEKEIPATGNLPGATHIPQPQGPVSSLLFERFADAPAAWGELCDSNDLAMDLKMLDALQRTLGRQCRCWGVIVSDASGNPVGCAALCYFATEIIETNNPAVLSWLARMRRMWPGFAKMGVLFCGLPVPSGSTHLHIRSGVAPELVVNEIHRVMQELAPKAGARLTVFKELPSESPFAPALSQLGYIRGDIPPMHHMRGGFKDFAEYRAALKSRYRAQVQRSQKKLKAAGFEVVTGQGGAFCAQYLNADTHRLYAAVQARAEHKLELMPASFFTEMAAALGDEAHLTVILKDGRVCAFTFAVTRGDTHYNLYSGLDYALNSEGDLYFNLFYHDLDQAFRAGVSSVHLGQTSDSFKSRLGSVTEPLFFFAHGRAKAFHTILKLFAPLAFPKVSSVEANDVFVSPSPACGRGLG